MKRVYIYEAENRQCGRGESHYTVRDNIAATCDYPIEKVYNQMKVRKNCVAFCKGGNILTAGAVYQYATGTYYYVVVREE